MPVRKPPLARFASEDLSDPQRPILHGEAADLGAYPLDGDEHSKFARSVARHDFLLQRTGSEEL